MKITQSYTQEQQRRIDELQAMSPQQWDSICRGCGLCCLAKVEMGGENFYVDLCCTFLDCETRHCRIYPERLRRCPMSCTKATIDVILDGKLMPESCAYREYIFGPAPTPACVDWTKIQHIRPFQVQKMTPDEKLKHVLAGSNKWNVR